MNNNAEQKGMFDFTVLHPQFLHQENTINRYYTINYSNVFITLLKAIHQQSISIYASQDVAYHCHGFHIHEQKDMFD